MNIVDRKARLKARRLLRKQRRKAEAVTERADSQVEKLFFRRFNRLYAVRRFIVLWTALVLLMSFGALWQVRAMDKFYLTTVPSRGGTYREGVIGAFTNSNPLFASTPADASVSRLLYPGLFKVSPQGKITSDLANSYEVDDKGLVYTVNLREDVSWHDGVKFTADDVIFTYAAIQNPVVKSPLRPSWQGVTVQKVSDSVVTFTLPNALSSFAYELTNGIVPKHILSKVAPEDYRSTPFNTIDAVGTGPYVLSKINVVSTDDINGRQEQVALERYENYFGSQHSIDQIVIRTYRDEDSMLSDFNKQVIQSMVGLVGLPDEDMLQGDGVEVISAPLTSQVGVFFNTSSPLLSDVKVREALVTATDAPAIRSLLGFRVVPSDSPFLQNQFPYNKEKTQATFDFARSNQLLDEAGWANRNTNGIRTKDGVPLQLRFISQSLTEYATITQKLQQDWSTIGVQVDAILQPEEDIQLGAIQQHSYDVLLYGISIGHDPDIFAYWHSSQIDPTLSSGLNLSEFKSATADASLEAGRTRIDEDLRAVKYEPFLDEWRAQSPAVMLYQPRFFMIVRGTFDGFESGQLKSAADRYWSIADWRIRNAVVVK